MSTFPEDWAAWGLNQIGDFDSKGKGKTNKEKEVICNIQQLTKDSYSEYITLQINMKKLGNSVEKWRKDIGRDFTKGLVTMAKKQMLICF